MKLIIDMPKPTNCGDCFLCRAGKCEKAYEAYLKMGSMFFNAIYEPDFMLDDCPIEEIDEAQLPKEGVWIEDDATYCGADRSNYKCSLCGKIGGTWRRGLKQDELPPFCGSCGSRMKTVTDCHTLEEVNR